MRINKEEHLKFPWRVHRLLPDLRIEDVWELPVEMDKDQGIGEVYHAFVQAMEQTVRTGMAGWLFRLRLAIGAVLGWEDKERMKVRFPEGSIRARYAEQEGLTRLDMNYPGFGDFVPVYDLQREMLAEIENETVLAAAHFGKFEKRDGTFSVQMTIYVKPKGWFGEFYMALIKPFRLLIVYPAMLGMIGRQWRKYQQERVVPVPVH